MDSCSTPRRHHCGLGEEEERGARGRKEALLSPLPGEQQEVRGAEPPAASPRLAAAGKGKEKGVCMDGGCCSNLLESICQFTSRITSGSVPSFCCRVRIFFFSLSLSPSPSLPVWMLGT